MNTYHSKSKSNNTFRNLLIMLILILLVLTTYIIYKSNSNNVKAKEINERKTIQVGTNNKINNWKVTEENLKNECNKQNLWIALEGKIDIRKTYTTTDKELEYKGSNNSIAFLVGKLNELKTRSLIVESQYLYEFAYDMNNIDISIDDMGKANVKLYRTNVKLRPISENQDSRILSNENGVLSKSFTVQEISAIMGRTQKLTYNYLVNDNELYDKALHNTEENIKELAEKFGIKEVNFEWIGCENIENEEVEVVNK